MNGVTLPGWDRLRHGGLLLDPPRLRGLEPHIPQTLSYYLEQELRRRTAAVTEGEAEAAEFVLFVLQQICGFGPDSGAWRRGPQLGAEWGRRAVTGETVKPRALWQGSHGAVLPMFLDTERRIGIGRGRKAHSGVLQWLRAGRERLALLTNGRQWRLLFAGLDFDAWCEWDAELWFEEGALSPQVTILRTLFQPALWTPPAADESAPLLAAILDSRKGQAELSAVLGERVREAVELLVQAHGDVLRDRGAGIDPADIYRAAVRVVMRLVVALFAESRELMPRDNPLYHGSYGVTGLLEELEKSAARGGGRLARSWNAWPRLLALFCLVRQGSCHPSLPVPAYGGELFAPGDPDSADGLSRALAVFETACFQHEVLPDRDVLKLLERITRTRVKVRQGRASTWVPAPVDFSDLSSEYIGILYEGLLDFELKTAPAGDPVVFLAVGNQPALPLSRLEAMSDKALQDLFEKLKDTSSKGDESEEEANEEEIAEEAGEESDAVGSEEEDPEEAEEPEDELGDERHSTRTRAEAWARRAVEVAGLAHRPRGRLTPERQLAHEAALTRKARQLVERVLLPGEWYLVRWGGTRKGAGTFYTRPGLAVPTVQRTLRPLAYEPLKGPDGAPDPDAPPSYWTPRKPQEILTLRVCDPACGSGSFLVAALRFLTEALYQSLHAHERLKEDPGRPLDVILGLVPPGPDAETAQAMRLPCRPEDEDFERRTQAVLRRYVVERCLYGVDLDPLAVELCRLALWVETMDRTLPFSFLDHKVKCGNSLVGAWFDQFPHYPVMAWKNREGGDKNHTHGVHFEKEARTKAIKEFVRTKLTPDLAAAIAGQKTLRGLTPAQAASTHADLKALLARLHELPVQDSAERARRYREELLGSPAYLALKEALDLWCACWFWPADDLTHAPLPTTLAALSAETRAAARHIAAAKRFFHWELEFPDVFHEAGAGFDAILGNPPWDTAKPNSKEFFSNIDPLYRSYGKQEALRYQVDYFESAEVEHAWLNYNADFRAQSNFVSYAASAFGDPTENEGQDRFTISRSKDQNEKLHGRWRMARAGSKGFADRDHPFCHQGSADLNLYKLFLEQAHVLLRPGGRMGLIVPSGLYSDHGTGALRKLFLDRCRWEWLFGFENREGIFEIHRSFKFNPVILQKGGRTEAIRTAFMRRKLEDWERAEELATPYARAQVERFSPRSLAILEIQSARDLEILEKIYANSVLLGDEGPDGWGIKYATEFHMTNDSKLFPPRPWWEERGYRPDEYSRWLQGDWRSIAELWAELGIDPTRSRPVEVELEEWLFEAGVSPEERAARARFVHGHWLKPGDVQRTEWKLRCAQPPYDHLPIPRADIPPGIILSRDADAWIREEQIDDVALPLYQGGVLSHFSPFAQGFAGGSGHSVKWEPIPLSNSRMEPQYLISYSAALDKGWQPTRARVLYRYIGSDTNSRTFIPTPGYASPAGHTVGVLHLKNQLQEILLLASVLGSFCFDWCVRIGFSGNGAGALDPSKIADRPVIKNIPRGAASHVLRLAGIACSLSDWWISCSSSFENMPQLKQIWALANSERIRLMSCIDVLVARCYGADNSFLQWVLRETDNPQVNTRDRLFTRTLYPKGFWRIDKDKDPELRHTVLTLVAFHDLEEKIRAAGGDREKGIEAFLNQNDGEGWMLPETLRLTDYGLGHDERAKHPQPVASRLGPRFYDWQLAQTADESWQECHLHARNLLGEEGYQQLLRESMNQGNQDSKVDPKAGPAEPPQSSGTAPANGQRKLF